MQNKDRANHDWQWLAALLLLTLFLFGRVLSFDFVSWDDPIYIRENALLSLPFLTAITRVFSSFYWHDYIPLTHMSHWLDAFIFGEPNPAVSHATSLGLHLLNISLLWLWLREFFPSPAARFFICSVFALHPLQVETVAWISERKGQLSATFTFLALVLEQRRERHFGYGPGYSFFFLCAMLSKTGTVFTPIVLAIRDRWLLGKSVLEILRRHGITVLIAGIIILQRTYAQSEGSTDYWSVLMSTDRLLKMPIQTLNALGFYLRSFLWPFDLSIIYPLFEFNWQVLVNIAIVLIFGLFTWRFAKDRLVVFFTGLSFLYILPYLRIIPLHNYVSDRYMYFPVIGLSAWIYLLCEKWIGRKVQWVLICAMLVVSTYQLSMWRTSLDLWTRTVHQRPWSAIADLTLGSALQEAGQIDGAIESFKRAVETGRKQGVSAQALSNLASIYSKSEWPQYYNLTEAEKYMDLAVKEPALQGHPGLFLRYNLARLKIMLGKSEEAKLLVRDLQMDLSRLNDPRLDQLKERIRVMGEQTRAF